MIDASAAPQAAVPDRDASDPAAGPLGVPTGAPANPPDDTGLISRPYLERAPEYVEDDPALHDEVGVRPYYLTGGRTRSFNDVVTYETVVAVAPMPSPYIQSLRFEQQALVALCAEPQSIVEISAKLHLPIAVAKVLAGDLAAFGVLEVFTPPDDVLEDIALIDTVIDGLRQL